MEGSTHAKTSLNRPVVSMQYWLVADRQTAGHTMTACTALAARRQCEWCEWQFTESKATRRSTQSVHTVTVSVRNVSRWYLRMPTSAVDYSAPGRERGYMDQTPYLDLLWMYRTVVSTAYSQQRQTHNTSK